ncbi:MAG: nickel pincer cofactor biosynthesis protein LarC [Firmicutes bacterium]|nr:nickel pincer cofactor biosynthesis protein LarC [Bacillota bacterium]
MKKVLYFDCFSGISGDMTLGALIGLGVDDEKLAAGLASLGLEGCELQVRKTEKYGISGYDVEVLTEDNPSDGCAASSPCTGEPHHHHHHHGHDHAHRSLADIRKIIQGSGLDQKVKNRALTIFETIGIAEAAVHNKPVDEVCFHEVGALDSIVDIVGTAICLELLNVDEIYCSPLHEGTGFVECQHGLLPIPVPAVSEILAGSQISLIQEDIPVELVTPTGAGILRGSAARCGAMPPMTMEAVGWGFGKRETGRLNALRVVLGTLQEEEQTVFVAESGMAESVSPEDVWQLEANIDDESGEILGYTMERLFEAGALDVWYVPIYMKKNRPAVTLSLLCKEADRELMENIILAETTTLGVRGRQVYRKALEREQVTVETELGPVRVKTASFGPIQKASPEYEDCARIAREEGIPLADIYSFAMEAFAMSCEEEHHHEEGCCCGHEGCGCHHE